MLREKRSTHNRCLAASAILVALVTVHAVVDIAAHTAMVAIGVRFRMTVGALEYAVIAGIGMAGGAHPIGIPVIGREIGVIECRARPTRCRVAHGASVREACRNVIGIVRLVVLVLVTAVAVRRNAGVVVIQVAIRACHRSMRASQGKAGVVVIEGRRSPCCRVVAYVALLREPRRRVIRIVGLLVVRQVTRVTRGVGQVVG